MKRLLAALGGLLLAALALPASPTPQQQAWLDRAHRILMQTQPGWIHRGTDFFITDAGLVGAETTIGGFHGFSEKGVPEFIRMRRATQDADDSDGWCARLRAGNNGGCANAWLVGDVRSGEIARLELGLKHAGFERTQDGYFLGSNIAENLKLLRLETDLHDTDIRLSAVARRVRWKQLMREYAGRIDAATAQQFEADCYDTCSHTDDGPTGRSLNARSDLDPQLGNPHRAPYQPTGAHDAKVVDTARAKRMSFLARWGSADGRAFAAAEFLRAHPQFDWIDGLLLSRPSQPWVEFTAGETAATPRD